jgi:hypothetical protein
MSRATTIKKVVIELNEKDVELTMAQARELYAALGELFKEKIREVSYPVYRRPYVWPWREPYWVCSSGTKATLSDSSVRLAVKSL